MLSALPAELVTHRLVLRPWAAADATARCCLWNDEAIACYVGDPPRSADEVMRYLDRDITAHSTGTAYRLAICIREGGPIIGLGAIGPMGSSDPRLELVIGIDKAHRRQGFALEAAKGLLAATFTANANLSQLHGRLAMWNWRSNALVRALGMRFCGLTSGQRTFWPDLLYVASPLAPGD